MPTTKRARRPQRAHHFEDGSGEPSQPSSSPEPSRPPAAGRRRRAEQTLLGSIRELPNFVRLLYGLMTDPRVDPIDKLLVGGAIGYVLLPEDVIPDFLPIIGEIDDVFVLVMALQRLIRGAGREVVLDHWMGDAAELRDLDLERVLATAVFFLPKRMRRRLRTLGRV